MDAAFRNALAKRDQLKRELERIEAFLNMYHEFAGDELVARNADAPPNDQAQKPKMQRASSSAMLDAAEFVLGSEGKPMDRHSLLKAVNEQGISVGGAKPDATLASALWRDKERFINLKGHGYWLRQAAYEPAGYDPTDVESDAEALPDDVKDIL